jgi:hypothetical protein
LSERVVKYLSKQSGNLAWAQVKENVVVLVLGVQILSDLDVVLVIRVAHPMLVDRRSKENLAGNSVEPVQVLNLVVVGQRVPWLCTEYSIPICLELLLLLFEPHLLLIGCECFGVGSVYGGDCKLVIFYDLLCNLI